MYSKLFPIALLLATLACQSEQESEGEKKQNETSTESVPLQNAETIQMVNELSSLITNGDPRNYFYWNHQRADIYKAELDAVAPENYNRAFYNYCQELLYAGESRMCINEIENYLSEDGRPHAEQINDHNYVLFELLALAYLRLGEQENCQNLHTPYSCILPLQDPALHQLEEGSRKAIELYDIIQNHYHQDKYTWLINLAYMTLGEYPDQVPPRHQIDFPSQKLEQDDFPRFEEIAMNVGVAENGLSGGTCVDDFNNDGYLDIFASSSGMRDQAKLFLNDGEGGFKDVTSDAGLSGILGGLNCLQADYNNDGFVDILLLRGGWMAENGRHPNSLLKNNGDGTFSDATRSAGLLSYHPTQTAAWADFDKDGYLDLFIGNESEVSAEPCELFRNQGDGTFKEVSAEHGLGNLTGFVKGVIWGDINNDTWPDLYVSDVNGKNRLFKNVNGQFEDISQSAGIESPFHSFPCWFWDVNNDGYQDLFVSSYDLTDLFDLAGDYTRELKGLPVTRDKSRLYLNNGDETFSDKTEKYGILKAFYAMGANFGDLDNDGYLDFYVGTGSPEYATVVPNRMFRSVKGKKFEEVTSAGGFGHIQKGHGVAFADLDQDGDQDIYAVMGGVYEGDYFTNVLFENPGFGNNWIIIDLEGKTTNRDAIGSRVTLTLDNGQKIHRHVSTGGSFGAHSLRQEIGLGNANSITTLTIHWQNGETEIFEDIAVNQKIKVIENEGGVEPVVYDYVPFKKGDGTHHHH